MIVQTVSDRLRKVLCWARCEPLVLFLLLGAGLFILYGYAQGLRDDPESRRISVDRQALAEYMQARAGTYDKRVDARIEAMPAAELSALVDSYVREEAMYREAVALGLEEKDYLIRQRLVQSLQFMFRNLGEAGDPSDRDLREFYARHRSRYSEPAAITFTHIYFAVDPRSRKEAQSLARRTMAALNSGADTVSPGESWPGDRFAYNLNYADRNEAMIASHFGEEMARSLFAAKADADRWQGPFESDSGVHLARIERLIPGKVMPFDQVRDEVASDYRQWQGRKLESLAVDKMLEDYDVSLSGDLRGLLSGGTE